MPGPSPAPDRPRFGYAVLAALVAVGSSVAVAVADPAGGQAAPPADACNGVEALVDVVGSASAKQAMIHWSLAICDQADVVADYTESDSKAGRDAVTPADAAVMGLTALPFTAEEKAALTAAKRTIVMVPILATSATCAYWDTYNPSSGKVPGADFPNLRISRRTLADILSGSPRDGTESSPELAEDNAGNPDFVVGPPYLSIETFMKAGSSEISYALTNWFAKNPQAAADFVKSSFEGATLPFEQSPIPLGPFPQSLNDFSTMVTRMVTSQQSLGIGCMDTAAAMVDFTPETPELNRLNLAWLDNADGAFVAPTGEAVTHGVDRMVPHDDGTFTVNSTVGDPLAYPLPLLVYAALPTCGIDTATRDAMDKVVSYAIGAGQANLPPGYVPLPDTPAQQPGQPKPEIRPLEVAEKQLALWKTATSAVKPCGQTTTPTTTTPPGGPTTTGDGGTTTTTAFQPVVTTTVPGGPGGPGSNPSGDPGGEIAGGPTGAGDDEGPLAPVNRIVAVARGLAALPPLVILGLGLGLLVSGPALQVIGGRRRAGSLPWSISTWFRRLLP